MGRSIYSSHKQPENSIGKRWYKCQTIRHLSDPANNSKTQWKWCEYEHEKNTTILKTERYSTGASANIKLSDPGTKSQNFNNDINYEISGLLVWGSFEYEDKNQLLKSGNILEGRLVLPIKQREQEPNDICNLYSAYT